MNVSNLSISNATNSAGTYTPQPGRRISILDTSNPVFPRNIFIDNIAVMVSKVGANGNPVILPLLGAGGFLAAAAAVNPNLSWPPIISSQPNNATNANNSVTSFNIAASAETAITYFWQNFGTGGWANLTVAGVYTNVATNTLNISNVTGLNNALYRCGALDASGTSFSNNASLTVVADPSVITQPSNSTVAGPSPATFSVVAVGASALSYQWQGATTFGGSYSNLSASAPYSNVTTNTLTIANTTGLTGHGYKCVVTDSASTATSNAALLTVN